MKLITVHVYPPIPERGWDWAAYLEGDVENPARHGHGRTKKAAIADLVERVDEWRGDLESTRRIAIALALIAVGSV